MYTKYAGSQILRTLQKIEKSGCTATKQSKASYTVDKSKNTPCNGFWDAVKPLMSYGYGSGMADTVLKEKWQYFEWLKESFWYI